MPGSPSTMEEVPEDEDHMWELLKDALSRACEGFVESRIREGENLKNDLVGKLEYMLTLVDFIEERSPEGDRGVPPEAGRQGKRTSRDRIRGRVPGSQRKLRSLQIRSVWMRRPSA